MKRAIRALGYVLLAGAAWSQQLLRDMNVLLERQCRTNRHPGLIVLCACSMLLGAVARAEEGGTGQPHVGAAVQADQKVEALLSVVERQITIGHTITPEGDNAVATWRLVLEAASPASPATRKALSDFAAHARSRAADEQAADRSLIASDLSVFAAQATELLQRKSAMPVSSSVAAPMVAPINTVPETPPSTFSTDRAMQDARPSANPDRSGENAAPTEPPPSKIDGTQARIPPAASAATKVSIPLTAMDKAAMTPPPTVGKTGIAPAVMPPHAGVTTRTTKELAAAAALARRGDAMLALQDISAARGFYEYAANAGNAHAAAALAETYDPSFLNHLGAVGTKPNPAMAADWYRKAAALGDQDAEARLRTLGVEAAK